MFRRVDAVVVVGIALSVILAVAVQVFGDAQDHLAILLAITGTALTMQIEIIARVNNSTDAENRKLRLLAGVIDRPGLSDAIISVVETATQHGQATDDATFNALLKQRLETCADQLRSIQAGVSILDPGDTSIMTSQVKVVRASIHATTFARVDLGWWSSSAGQKYLLANEGAVQRGVHIQRVLVYDRWNEAISELANHQVACGIALYVVSASSVSPPLRRNMAVYDRRFLVEDVTNSHGDITGYLHAIDPGRVNDALAVFNQLQAIAKVHVPVQQ